jgi:hypothetical protein
VAFSAITEFQTEYLIIANYETPILLNDEDLYAYQIFPVVLEMIGNDEGVMNRFHRAYRHDAQYLTLLAALEYDILYGDRMVYEGYEYPTMWGMVMGSRPIHVTDCYVDEKYLYVKGTHFTAYSVITLDGKQKSDTEFVDASTLRIWLKDPAKEWKNLESVTVRQLSASYELLSETLPFFPNHHTDQAVTKSFSE